MTTEEVPVDSDAARRWADTVDHHRGQVRQRIIDAALELVAERGVADVAMAHIATRAGVGRATLYNHFPDLEAIVLASMHDAFEAHHRTLDIALAEATDPLEQLRAVVEATVDYFASPAHRQAAAAGPMAFSPEGSAAAGALFAGLHRRITGLVEAAVASGHLTDDVDPAFAAAVLAQVLSAARTEVLADRMSSAEAAQQAFRLFVLGAGTPSGRRRVRR